jgi:hypothetical protein
MTDEHNALLYCVNHSRAFCGIDLNWENAAQQVANPDWSPPEQWNPKWEDLIPDALVAKWGKIPLEAKIIARIMACEAMSVQEMYSIS